MFADPRKSGAEAEDDEKQLYASSANKSRWAHVGSTLKTKRSQGLSNDAIIELLVSHERPQEVLELIFGRFFQSTCECPLLPLTTNFFPREHDFDASYKGDTVDVFNPGNAVTLVPNERLFLQEVLALRLT